MPDSIRALSASRSAESTTCSSTLEGRKDPRPREKYFGRVAIVRMQNCWLVLKQVLHDEYDDSGDADGNGAGAGGSSISGGDGMTEICHMNPTTWPHVPSPASLLGLPARFQEVQCFEKSEQLSTKDLC